MPTRTYSKYRNIKSNGYDSRKEERRHKELLLLEKSGQIEKLKNQVKYELIPSQRMSGKVVERAVYYIADFTYYADGHLIVEDVKSEITRKNPVYIIKRKLMLYKYGIRVKEV